jgi:hypothetical protein
MATVRTAKGRKGKVLPVAPNDVTEDAIVEVLETHEDPTDVVAQPDAETRYEMVRTAAYYIAEQRGFAPGYEMEDWLAAEKAVDGLLTRQGGRA